jgi:hypothetical protein
MLSNTVLFKLHDTFSFANTTFIKKGISSYLCDLYELSYYKIAKYLVLIKIFVTNETLNASILRLIDIRMQL